MTAMNKQVCKGKGRYKKIPLDISIHLRYLHQDMGVGGVDLRKRYPNFSKTSIYRHMTKKIGDNIEDRRKGNKGRPKVITPRDVRNILRQVPLLRASMQGRFTLKDIKRGANICERISDMTVSRQRYSSVTEV